MARKSPVFRENTAPKGVFWAISPHEWLVAQSLCETISQNLTTTWSGLSSPDPFQRNAYIGAKKGSGLAASPLPNPTKDGQ